MKQRIKILDYGNATTDFLIQCALYNLTGSSAWRIKLKDHGSRHNWTDGEIDEYWDARRLKSSQWSEKLNRYKNNYEYIRGIHIHSNDYDPKGQYETAVGSIKMLLRKKEEHD